jgi:ABC-type Mn2+/Zn2+ transport system permease subunit
MPLQKWPVKKILTITLLLIGIFCFSLLFAKNWLTNMINKNLYVKKTFDKFAEFVFLTLIGFFSIIMVKFSGVLFAVSLSIFPALIAHYFERGPVQTILIACGLNIIFTIIAFYIMIENEGVNFNVILLGLQFCAFIFISLFKKTREMAIFNSSSRKKINQNI